MKKLILIILIIILSISFLSAETFTKDFFKKFIGHEVYVYFSDSASTILGEQVIIAEVHDTYVVFKADKKGNSYFYILIDHILGINVINITKKIELEK